MQPGGAEFDVFADVDSMNAREVGVESEGGWVSRECIAMLQLGVGFWNTEKLEKEGWERRRRANDFIIIIIISWIITV